LFYQNIYLDNILINSSQLSGPAILNKKDFVQKAGLKKCWTKFYKSYRRKPVDFSLADECVPVLINLDAEYTLVLSINSLALSKISNSNFGKIQNLA
jgi:hypothetical protein